MTKDFGKGFTVANIKNMRQFYLTFPNGYALRSELSWTHYRSLMRVENETPEDIIRDPYVLEFLGLEPNTDFYESDLEQALITHLQKFLLELGRGFSFVARQKRFTFDGRHFRIDLVFYNYILKCFGGNFKMVLEGMRFAYICRFTLQKALRSSESMRWFPTSIFSVGDDVELSFDVAGAVFTPMTTAIRMVSLQLMFPTVQHVHNARFSVGTHDPTSTLRNITITLR